MISFIQKKQLPTVLNTFLLKSKPSANFSSNSLENEDETLTPFHPAVKKETMQKIRRYFPGAQFAIELKQRINFSLLKAGGRPSSTLFACSVCPDEINHYPNSLNARLSRGAGKACYMGGLGGIPFLGK